VTTLGIRVLKYIQSIHSYLLDKKLLTNLGLSVKARGILFIIMFAFLPVDVISSSILDDESNNSFQKESLSSKILSNSLNSNEYPSFSLNVSEEVRYERSRGLSLKTYEIPAFGESYEGEVGESISFSATVEDGTSPYEWQWDFGDGEYSFEQNPSHAYEEEGTYEAYVLVMDSNDNYGMAEVTVVISASSGGTVSSDSESGITMFVALITTIIIIGIAVLIYITRR